MNEPAIPTPESVIGYPMGTARKLPDWQEIVDYFETLAGASDRVELEILGETTLGKPYIAVTISSAENLARRDELREISARLYNPHGLSEEETQDLIERGRTTNFLLLSQHSSEIGSCLMSLELAARLAADNDPETLEILENTITVIVPNHNPDGHQMEVDWYRKWLDTKYEGQGMPWLYHHYVGHDNNRDWFMLTQKETRLYVELHNREHPQMVFDMHQMQRDGARFMVPPFIDPLDPNQDPLIQQGFADLGTYIAARMTAEGLTGVATNIIFDNYSPSLAYGNYHGSVDLLSEAASVKLATPVTIKEKELDKERGFDPSQRTWNHPMPWKGGEWTLAEIVEYDRVAALAFIEHAARNRRQWLRNYLTINRRTIERSDPPFAYLIPEEQDDPITAYELLETLQAGAVTIERATSKFEADGVRYPEGTRLIRVRQPSGNYVKTLLEIQKYPDLRQWPDGPPTPPYDITGHTLGLQTNTKVIEVKLEFEVESEVYVPELAAGIVHGEGRVGYLIPGNVNESFTVMNRALKAGLTIHRLAETDESHNMPTGSFVVLKRGDPRSQLEEFAATTGVNIFGIDDKLEKPTVTIKQPRIGIYKSWATNIDEGWCRWILERYEFDYETLHNNDIRQGNLAGRFDAILLPQQAPKAILDGIPEKNKYDEKYPLEYTGGLGIIGASALRDFAEAGGTLIALDNACDFAIEHLYLPVKNVVAGLKQDEFYCPGSLLRIIVDDTHQLGFGMCRDEVASFVNSPVYELTGSDAGTIVARYPSSNPRLSGWIMGENKLAGKGSVIEVPIGKGRAVLIAFRTQFRAQSRGSYRFLFNALTSSVQKSSMLRLM